MMQHGFFDPQAMHKLSHQLNRRQLITAGASIALSDPTWAQVGAAVSRIIVAFAPGGAREMPARAIQHELSRELGQNWIIENKPGAGGAIGTSFVANAAPDGKTLLMAASSHFTTAAMGAKPFYEPVKDFVPVANIGNQSYVLMVNAALPIKTVGELIQYAKAKPGVLNYNSAGVSSSTHLAMAYLARRAQIDMVHVPYKGTQEAANDVAGGRGHAVIVPTAGLNVYLQDARLRVIGITAAKRSALLPQIPTLNESGLPGYGFESWFGLLAPAHTPSAVVEQINAAVNKVIALKTVRERLQQLGLESPQLSVDGFNKLFLADRELMTKIVKESGITRD
jgi:tripartite-type tricarboxylate transporter receptor subunit TctC